MRYLILLTLLLSCQKEIVPECLVEQTGTIIFENQKNKDYFISVDGITATISGDFVVSGISAGFKQVKAVHNSRLQLFEVDVLPCDTVLIILN